MKRLDLKDPNVWNKWRELYDKLTDEEQHDFADECEMAYPRQMHYGESNFDLLFKDRHGDRVLEIGGWKGELAHHCLSKYDITRWFNVDACRNAAAKAVTSDKRYEVVVPEAFRWFYLRRLQEFDVCVSAHTIEHFSNGDLEQLIKYISGIKTVMFDAPLQMAGDDWNGYGGTHKLTMGWDGVNALMVNEGYSVEEIGKHCFLYRLPC